MSSPPNTETTNFGSSEHRSTTDTSVLPPALVTIEIERMLTAIRALGFWAAIVLPFLHIPLLATGLSSRSEAIAFTMLLAANIVAIRIGYRHRPGATSER